MLAAASVSVVVPTAAAAPRESHVMAILTQAREPREMTTRMAVAVLVAVSVLVSAVASELVVVPTAAVALWESHVMATLTHAWEP